MSDRSPAAANANDSGFAAIVLAASRRFLTTPVADLDAAIATTLAEAGRAAGSDRCMLILADPVTGRASMTHEWRAPGLSPAIDRLARLDLASYPWWLKRLTVADQLTLKNLDEYPPEAAAEAAMMAEMGLVSLTASRTAIDGRPTTVLLLGHGRPQQTPSPHTAALIQLLGDLVAAALRRRDDTATLHLSEERADVAVRGTGVGLWVWHVQTGETTFDDRWAEIIGYELDELQPVSIDTWIEFVHPDDLALSNERLQAHFRGETDIYECEARMRHKNGAWIWVLDRGKVFEWDEQGQPQRMAGTHLDITDAKHAEQERERMQDELLQAQKMESVGHLAGGVAHDFNNLLTVISGHAELIEMEGSLSPGASENLRLVRDAAERARELTQQLLTFSRKQVTRPRPVDLDRHIEESLKMYGRLIGEDIRLEFTPAGRPLTIMADPQQLDQVLANLLVNARDALHAATDRNGGRRIDISVVEQAIADGPAPAPAHGLAAGSYAVLTVADNGVGMDTATRERIFDPFFTTKGRDRGTGLGLATVFGIVQQHDGGIAVDSRPGEGAAFRIFWPMAANGAACAEEAAGAEPQAGAETILVAEDEPEVRRFTQHALERLGYRVVVAADGAEALALLEAMKPPPDLLLTDVIMPGLDGAGLAKRVRALYPDLPILFSSGYTDDVIGRQGMLDAAIEVLQKPYSIAEMTRRIRMLLGPA